MEAGLENITNSYTLNDEDRIVSVGPQWDQYALDEDAPESVADKVLGREIWDFIEGHQTRDYLFGIFHVCRIEYEEFNALYRCDTPDLYRLFRLIVKPHASGMLTVDHALIEKRQSAGIRRIAAFPDHHDTTRCSICCAFQIGGKWIDLEVRPEPGNFAKSYSICPKCQKTAQQEIDRIKAKPKLRSVN